MIDIEHLSKNFADKVLLERTKRRWSQEKLAEYADLHRTTISSIENQKFFITIDNAAKIANAFEMTMGELFDFNS